MGAIIGVKVEVYTGTYIGAVLTRSAAARARGDCTVRVAVATSSRSKERNLAMMVMIAVRTECFADAAAGYIQKLQKY